MIEQKQPAVTPGEMLVEEFLRPAGVELEQLSGATRIPMDDLTEIAEGRRPMTAETALRLARFFGNSPQYWMNMQADYDLRVARRDLEERVRHEVEPMSRA